MEYDPWDRDERERERERERNIFVSSVVNVQYFLRKIDSYWCLPVASLVMVTVCPGVSWRRRW